VNKGTGTKWESSDAAPKEEIYRLKLGRGVSTELALFYVGKGAESLGLQGRLNPSRLRSLF